MAKQKDVWVSGRIGNLVFFRRGEQHLVRAAPGTIRRTGNMKKRNSNFGLAVGIAAQFRRSFAGVIPFPKDRVMQNALGGAFSKWLGKTPLAKQPSEEAIPHVKDFYLSAGPYSWQHWLDRIQVKTHGNGHKLNIPTDRNVLNFNPPKDSVEIVLQVAAAKASFGSKIYGEQLEQSWTIALSDLNPAPIEMDLPLTPNPGEVLLVMARMHFRIQTANGLVDLLEPGKVPAKLVAARYRQAD